MELKSTLQVFNEADEPTIPGVTTGQTAKQLAGNERHPSERLMIRLVTFEVGAHARLHWHLIEAFYYVISGRAIMTDIEGKTMEIGPGTVIYAPPGILGSHSWKVTEKLQLIGVRATAEAEKANLQFFVDTTTMDSSLSFNLLENMQAVSFKSLY